MGDANATTVERMTLVSDLGPLHFDPAVLLAAGETFWVDGDTLLVRGSDGATRQVQGLRDERVPGRYHQPGLRPQRPNGE